MAKKFLNQGLILTKRFGVESEPRQNEELEQLQERENEHIREGAEQKEGEELHRRKAEVLGELEKEINALSKRREEAEAQLHTFEALHKEVEKLPNTDEPENFASVRQTLRKARGEILKYAHAHEETSSQSDNKSSDITELYTNLSWWQLTKLGFGVLWPLLVTLIGMGLLIAGTMYSVFRV